MRRVSNSFTNKVVVITGASSGIGRACAVEFAERGAIVVLAARNEEKLKEVESLILSKNGIAFPVRADIRQEDDCKNLIERTIEKYGKLDVLINNAGISMRANFKDLDMSVIKEVMDTNFYGAVYCTKFALPHLLDNKGVVVGISSISGLTPLPGRTGYCASKYALDGFLNTLRIENRRQGLRVLVVHPGFTTSNIRNKALNENGVFQAYSPRDENKMIPAEKVARIIADATRSNKRELILTKQGKMLVWLFRLLPGLADRILLREMNKEPNSPSF